MRRAVRVAFHRAPQSNIRGSESKSGRFVDAKRRVGVRVEKRHAIDTGNAISDPELKRVVGTELKCPKCVWHTHEVTRKHAWCRLVKPPVRKCDARVDG